MQLNKANIKQALTTATCSLLGGAAAQAAAVEESDWEFDSAVLFYSETDRVSAVEPVIQAKKNYGEDKILSWKFVLDALTGASANGAVAANMPQVFTSPSGNGTYDAAADETPLDDVFKDTRVAISSNWQQKWGSNNTVTFGANVSNEYDFQSFGVTGAIAHDMNQKNTTLTAGLGLELDMIEPVGGVPIAFANMVAPDQDQPKGDADDDKTITDILLGVTQVINKNTLMQFNYSYSSASGYLTDPYKVLTVVDENGDPDFGVPASEIDSLNTFPYLYENRPEDRTKHSFYWQTKYHMPNADVIDFSYRFMTDDWGIDSHTLDFRYRWELGNQQYLEPHLRYYQQSAADFYYYFLTDDVIASEGLNQGIDSAYASADYRLGEMTGVTLGLKYGRILGENHKFDARLEFYQQTGDSNPAQAFGNLSNQDLYPDVDAVIAQIGYSFVW